MSASILYPSLLFGLWQRPRHFSKITELLYVAGVFFPRKTKLPNRSGPGRARPMGFSPWASAHGLKPMGFSPWALAHGLQPMGFSPWALAHGL